MIPLIPLLVDTDVVAINSDAMNVVHEWGVVVFQESGDVLCNGPWEPGEYSEYVQEAEAPVIWIHGSPFSGSLAVHTGEQSITYTYPEPAQNAPGVTRWDISANHFLTEMEEERTLYQGPFYWGIDFWRAVPSLHLSHYNTEVEENFLYYECTVGPEFSELFFLRDSEGDFTFNNDLITEGLQFAMGTQYLMVIRNGTLIPLNMTVNPELAQETICRWADSRLNSTEITALWETWRPVLENDEENWFIFPIPEEYHNLISTIELTTDSGSEVEYERLFLGAVKI